jgi:YidC/Oxa1 family membrane protein insertase
MSDFNNTEKGGDKRTLLAVILSVIVITAGFAIQGALFPPAPPAQAPAAAAPAAAPAASQAAPSAPASGIRPAGEAVASEAPAAPQPSAEAQALAAAQAAAAPVAERSYTISTDLVEAVFTNKGGDLVSLKLKKHKDKAGAVDLILPGSGRTEGLSVAFGGPEAAPVDALMNARMLDDKTIEFSRSFLADVPGKSEPVAFTYRKAFAFRDGEYLFGMAVSLENSLNEYVPLDSGGFAYTVKFGPQIGPDYNHKSKNADYRKIVTFVEGKRRQEKPKTGAWSPKGQPAWTATSGKYFAFIAIPELASYTTTVTGGTDPLIGATNVIALSRPAIKASKQSDSFYFYFGPKTSSELAKYDYADRNGFGKSGLALENAADGSGILSWLETGLKFALKLFYGIIPNYGVAIILVTLLVKILMFPLTKKGSIASSRMQEIQPQIQALQAKYKNNPQKLNQEMAEVYKREGYNPMSGCLPLLIQFPIFIAMYNLFNNHFDLRGALFIAGWIPDLSMPETVWNFAPFKLPLLGWSDLRALPILYLASQLVYGKFTQQPTSGPAASQMKFMMYGMPIMFFFMLYDVPSGLLVYWIASNLLTIAQQVAINDLLKKRKQGLALQAAAPQAGARPGKKDKGSKSLRGRAGPPPPAREWAEPAGGSLLRGRPLRPLVRHPSL